MKRTSSHSQSTPSLEAKNPIDGRSSNLTLNNSTLSLEATEGESLPAKKLRALEKAGVTREKMYDRLAEGLDYGVWVTDADDMGEPVRVFKPDLLVRHKYLETAAKIYGDLRPDGNVQVGVGVNVGGMSREEREIVESYRKSPDASTLEEKLENSNGK